jgi:transcription initiation factor IIE alpha subunit
MSQLQACPECGQPLRGSVATCPLCGHDLAAARAAAAKVWRIPCPNGHLFTIENAWLGRQLICPTCNAPFVAEAADSLEMRDEQQRRLAQQEEAFARTWLKRSIWVGVIGGLVLVGLIVSSLMRR